MQITLSYEQQMDLEKDIRQELDTLKALGDGLKNEVEQAHSFADLRMGIGHDFQRVQAGLDLFLNVVEQLDDVDEEYAGGLADSERGKVLRRVYVRCMNHVIHRIPEDSPFQTQAVTKLLELYRYA